MSRFPKLQNNVLRFCREEKLFVSGSCVVAGVSGGADSIAMLHILHSLRRALGIELVVAHLNHHLRGVAAKMDQQLVAECAADLGLRFFGGSAYVRERARRRDLSLEAAAREARLEFFRSVVRRTDASAIVLAHTADDQAETFLLRLLRGSGMSGLAAMAPLTELNRLLIARPLLRTDRSALLSYLRSNAIQWREDESNRDPAYTRNRVRHQLLPLLESEFDPAIRGILQRTAAILREDDKLLEMITADAIQTLRDMQGRLNMSGVRQLPVALQRRVIRQWLTTVLQTVLPPDFDTVERILRWMGRRRSSGKIELDEDILLSAEYDWLSVGGRNRSAGNVISTHQSVCSVIMPRTGTVYWPPDGLRVTTWTAPGIWKRRPEGIGKWPCRATVSLKAAGRRRLRLRSRQPGDRFSPLGMSGTRKLQDIFTDARVPVDLRDSIPLIVCGEEIVWVPGYRVARGWEVKDASERVQHIVIEKGIEE